MTNAKLTYFIAVDSNPTINQINEYAQSGVDWAKSCGFIVVATFAGIALIRFVIDQMSKS